MGTTKPSKELLFLSLGSVPILRHCAARKKAILMEFRRYPAWWLFKGCLRRSLCLQRKKSFPEMVISCFACKRFLPFWPWNHWWVTERMRWWGLCHQLRIGAALCSSRMAEDSVVPIAVSLTKGPSWAPRVQCIESLKYTWSMQALFNFFFFIFYEDRHKM